MNPRPSVRWTPWSATPTATGTRSARSPRRFPWSTIPLRVEVPKRPLDPLGSSPSVLFVGGFGHLPNVDAAVRLATQIFPRVRARCPEAALYLVGDKPPRRVRELAGDHVVVTGRVDDVTPYLDRAAVVVAPLRLGGGTRVKVLEALAAGKAVVASPLAAEGIEAVDGEHLLLAESDEELVDATARLLADPDARSSLGRRARQLGTEVASTGSRSWRPTTRSTRVCSRAGAKPPRLRVSPRAWREYRQRSHGCGGCSPVVTFQRKERRPSQALTPILLSRKGSEPAPLRPGAVV